MNIQDPETRGKLKIFVDMLVKRAPAVDPALVEKDIYLTIMLNKLASDKTLRECLVFKGGTALVKAYLGYYRFSEDLDFTWKNQKNFAGKSQQQIRKICRELINVVGQFLQFVCKELGFDFVFAKNNRKYVQMGGSNKMVTFKIHYESVASSSTMFFKIQINFFEPLLFEPVEKKLVNFIEKEEFVIGQPLLADALEEYVSPYLYVYDVKEILCEKIRAALTRRILKARDILDIYKISKEYKIDFLSLKEPSKKKLSFILPLYQKYRENMLIIDWEKAEIKLDDIKQISITEININELEAFAKGLFTFLNKLKKEVIT